MAVPARERVRKFLLMIPGGLLPSRNLTVKRLRMSELSATRTRFCLPAMTPMAAFV
jgi:hypothetical protein